MNVFDYFFEEHYSKKKDFIVSNRENYSFEKIFHDSLALSNEIKNRIGEQKNIILIGPNSYFFVVAYLAIFKSGNTCVPLNPAVEKENLSYIIEECKASMGFISKPLVRKLNLEGLEVIDEDILSSLGEKPTEIKEFTDISFDKERIAEIIFTSGSTGMPKGVMISHKNIIANTDSIIEYLNIHEDDRMLVVLPFFYCYGLSLLHTHLKAGGSVVFNNSFIFLGAVLNDLKNHNCTGFAGVPSHFQILLRKSKDFKTMEFPSLRYVTQAGGKLHMAFISEFREAHPEIEFFVMYGQTEATARLSYVPPAKLKEKLGSIGIGIPGVQLNVVGPDGKDVKAGEQGEIVAKGDNIMPGYLNDEELTGQTIKDGWLHTGDLGHKDEDGFIFLTARKKEIIKVGGKRISPKEIEEVIVSMPDIIDCSIEAVDDDLLGEAIKAIVIADKSVQERITENDIREYCAKHLAQFKIPQIIEFKTNMTVSSTGKKVKGSL